MVQWNFFFKNTYKSETMGIMDKNFLQQIKENLLQRKQNILEFLNQATPTTMRIRTGPAGDDAIGKHLHLLDTTLGKIETDTLGRCDVCNDDVEVNRLEMDYTACVCLEHLTGDERTRLENDLELSQKVQQALLPHSLPDIRHGDIAAFSQPAHIVGGDYFDFLRFKDGSHALVIADVMGKGMAASMLMSNLQASLRIIIGESTEPSEVVKRLNQIFYRNIRLTKFVTLFLARYNEDTRILTYCNAGHNPPLLQGPDNVLEELRPTGAAIGLIDQSSFVQKEVRLFPSSRLFMYTDGVVESVNEQRELFGDERLKDLLRVSPHLSPSLLISSVRESLQQFAHSKIPVDDTTIIVMDVRE
jgi:serine phosphatase RsbU (regulator of sigma subunit)